jgi:hypothetical protein
MPLPLKDMTVLEKIAAMEEIWEDLSRTPEAVESPAWHKKILDARRRKVAEGKACWLTLEQLKRRLNPPNSRRRKKQ